jgi:putative transposase
MNDSTEIYHILNRGTDKRTIVQDEEDHVRFIHDLYVFNDLQATPNFILADRHQPHRARTPLVHIHALLLSPAIENGIPKFMKKLNMGYAKYFNEKYVRTGSLWQGKYKKIHIQRDAHFLYIPYYIHLNALDMSMPQWRKGGVRNITQALGQLKKYRWSSHLDYLGEKNFPSITEREFLAGVIGTRSRYEQEIGRIITNQGLAEKSEYIEN